MRSNPITNRLNESETNLSKNDDEKSIEVKREIQDFIRMGQMRNEIDDMDMNGETSEGDETIMKDTDKSIK